MSLVSSPIFPAVKTVRAGTSVFKDKPFHNGISLNFPGNYHYVKASGSVPTVAALTTLFTFTGGNQSMYMGAGGLLIASATNTPRIEYDAGGSCLGLLMEASRTNLWLQSQTIGNASWTKLRASVSDNTTSAPDGTTTADTIIEDSSASTTHLIRQDISVTSGTSYTASFWAKAAGRTQVSFQFGSDNSCFAFEAGIFTLSGSGTAATLSGSPIGVTIQSFPNGWYRCRVSATAAATAVAGLRIFLADSGSTTYNGDGSSGAYIWGAQFEAGAFASSYIPTTTVSVARTADSCVRTLGTEFSATAGTVVIQGRASGGQDAATSQYAYAFNNGTAAERIALLRPLGADTASFRDVAASAIQCAVDGAFSNSTVFKSAAAWSANDFAHSLNGGTVQTDAAGTVATVDRLGIGELAAVAASNMNGHIRTFDYYPTRMINADLVRLSGA